MADDGLSLSGTIRFLRRSATQLHTIADEMSETDAAIQLRLMARQLEAEAAELEKITRPKI
jgi:hypothetical protein